MLRLELTDPGFDASVLCEFRARLLVGEAEELLFETLLTWCHERQLVKAGGRQRTDSTHVLAAVRALNRIEVVGEAMRHTLNTLAQIAPTWLRSVSQEEWSQRYARRAEDDRLPEKQAAREALAQTIGNDGWKLLNTIYQASAPTWLREVPAVDILRRMWIQNYQWDGNQLRWRASDSIPPATQFLSSPYDLEAHYARKHTTQWIGYKVHLTETCDDELPHLITNVETTTAPVPDGQATPSIHASLKKRELLPQTHIVDTGFLDAALLVETRARYNVDLFGPTRLDYRWQAREQTGFAAAQFQIDWEQHQATCPQGKRSTSWTASVDRHKNEVIRIKFSSTDCRVCSQLSKCVRSKKRYPRRMLSIRHEHQHEALQAARQREGTKAFQKEYDRRAGIEATISRGVRTSRLRRTPYIGLKRTHLGHVLTAVGLNWLRLGEWLLEIPRAKTRRSPFTRLMAGTSPT